ncbi:unnamed protein product [Leptosia nina]|uniref:Hyaluronidase n=1 Tax=Leptosia nina TaxID=320188 RepID=A0AAV1JDN6_9NEOP
MRFLLFLVLTRYAVRCDDESNNYYVIEVPDVGRDYKKPFRVYWNVPTMQCKSKKIPFDNLHEKYGIIQNKDDKFLGENIAILYDPGLFPALLKDEKSGKFKFRNGGVPQEGNLDSHLDAFKNSVKQSIPDADFNGVAIIDFESWRPIFRQNFGVLTPYKNVSYDIEYKQHWWWPKTWIAAEAKQRFEDSARTFMQTTISIGKQMRPKALWGYYGFPYCFNMASNNKAEDCPKKVKLENDEAYWLWEESSALYPSVYSSQDLSSSELSELIRGRLREASRLKSRGTPILPYFWYKYRDGGFLKEGDLSIALQSLYKSNASGLIIWGSSNDVNSIEKCHKLKDYVESTLGPYIAKYTKNVQKLQNNYNSDDENDVMTNVTLSPGSDFDNSSDNQSVINDEDKNQTIKLNHLNDSFIFDKLINTTSDVSKQDEFDQSELDIQTSTVTESKLTTQNTDTTTEFAFNKDSTTEVNTEEIFEFSLSTEVTTRYPSTNDITTKYPSVFEVENTTSIEDTSTTGDYDLLEKSEFKRILNNEYLLFTNITSQDFTTENNVQGSTVLNSNDENTTENYEKFSTLDYFDNSTETVLSDETGFSSAVGTKSFMSLMSYPVIILYLNYLY